ncbi:hypothetical protein PAPYR_8490 [Paratrimastix pyriformis]|uniref:Tyrosine-protein kinase ephrin type A/B receptor-like domain-containing protein n=1 Tax=Paratrimastix pyriformis TaxID=342808 RepID=A0ABQ8UAH5_9EUKA|nr:hypothetical protein PAPYR_8490 [Paratrimastix pyriformis]
MQLLCAEAETSDLYIYREDFGVWKKVCTPFPRECPSAPLCQVADGDGASVSLPATGVKFGDGCIFYGGSFDKPNSQLTTIQPNGAWLRMMALMPAGSHNMLLDEAVAVYLDPYYMVLANGEIMQTTFPGSTLRPHVDPTMGDQFRPERRGAGAAGVAFPPSVISFVSPVMEALQRTGSVALLMWSSAQSLYIISINQVVRISPRSSLPPGAGGSSTPAKAPASPHTTVPPRPAPLPRPAGTTFDATGAATVTGCAAPPASMTSELLAGRFSYKTAPFWDPFTVFYRPAQGLCEPGPKIGYYYNAAQDVWTEQALNTTISVTPAVQPGHPQHLLVPLPLCRPPPRLGSVLLGSDWEKLGLTLFHVGGYRHGAVLNDTWMGTRLSGVWAQVDAFFGPLEPRAFHQGGVWNESLYLLGGFTTGKRAPASFGVRLSIKLPLNSTYKPFTPTAADPTWAPPALLWGHAASFDTTNGLAYITGGVNTSNLWIYRLDLAQLRWLEPIRPTSTPGEWPAVGVSFHATALIPELSALCLFGGVVPEGATYVSLLALPCLIDRGPKISEPPIIFGFSPPAPTALNAYQYRYGHAMAYLGDGDLLIYGGQTRVSSANDMLHFNLFEHSARSLAIANPPAPAAFFSALQLGEMVVIVGGGYSRAWDPLATIENATFQADTPTAALSMCPRGTAHIGSGAGCAICGEGSYSTVGATSCSKCPAGSYQSFKGQGVLDCPGATGPTTCQPCKAGTYSALPGASTRAHCRLCPAGTFATTSAATSAETCLPCPDPALCRPGSTGPSGTMPNGTAALETAPLMYDAEQNAVKWYVYYGLAGGLGLVALAVGALLLICRSRRPPLLRLLRLADIWPGFLPRVDELGVPLRTRSPIGGLLGLGMVLIVAALVGIDVLRVLSRYDVRRDITLREGIPPEAFLGPPPVGLTAHVSIASLGHHGPCLANGTADVCDPGMRPTLDTGSPSVLTCSLRPDGACMMNMTMGIRILGQSVITVDVTGTDMLYNSGWWWEIAINQTDSRQLLLPPEGGMVFHGSVGTAATATMTFLKYTKNNATRWQHWALTADEHPRLGSAATADDFYHEEDRLLFTLAVTMSPYHELTADTEKESPVVVLMDLMGALSGAFGGMGVLKHALEAALDLALGFCDRITKRRAGNSKAKRTTELPRVAQTDLLAAIPETPAVWSKNPLLPREQADV